MALFEDLTKGSLSTVLLGLGVAIAAPSILPNLASGLRPLAKTLVKGGVTLYDAAKEGVAEAGEQFNDLVAETRAEMAQDDRSRGMRTGEASAARSAGDMPRTRRRSRG
ncbi:MAG TPA: DUF5132 domain-containing protein [Nitrospira sp.]|nr:DUF5132 domain-containing protein [Nitrospira sp.]